MKVELCNNTELVVDRLDSGCFWYSMGGFAPTGLGIFIIEMEDGALVWSCSRLKGASPLSLAEMVE